MLRRGLFVIAGVAIAVWGFNTSIFAAPAEDAATDLLAHRGVYQTYDKTDLGMQDCTANRIFEPGHGFLENTLPSIGAAFEAGADIVEIDVRRTQDGHFAVFHDWTLDCRTEASGRIEHATRAGLKTLDIGYGYTADGGETYPFRGQFIGAMPMLDEVFEAFPDGRFLINLKSNNAAEGKAFADLVNAHPGWRANVAAYYGGPRSVMGAKDVLPDIAGVSRAQMKDCLKDYLLFGWAGHIPSACRDTLVGVPVSHTGLIWGWPHKFTQRMGRAGSRVILFGPFDGRSSGTTGINDPETVARIPDNFDGLVWTDKIEEIAPLIAKHE